MGLNMPAKSVVFMDIRKFDGKEHRILKTAEYIQMAGRAGRRGKDPIGTVIIKFWDTPPSVLDFSNMIAGKSNKMESKFYLRFSMILSILRSQDLTIEDVLLIYFI